jgi:hypothetical protein
MATDYRKLREDLSRFYDFAEKTVLFIGAGGRQLLDPAIRMRRMIAVDKDLEALRQLQAEVAAKGLEGTVEVVGARFEDVTRPGDTVYFEFCLHEMDDPEAALRHARSLAPDVVVFDHSAGSEWSFYGAEEVKVARSSLAMERFGVRRRIRLHAEQRFETYAELLAKVSPQGPTAIGRVERFAGTRDIVIPMAYEMVLL